MKTTTQGIENGQAVFHIEAEPSDMEKSMSEAYRELAKKLRIPGFRKGKTPRPVLESFVGKEGLRQEALEHLIPLLCERAVEEQKLEIIAQPQIEILEQDPVAFKATFPLRPKVELGDYRSVRLSPEPVELTQDKVDDAMQQLLEQSATWVPVDRAVKSGDLVTMDIEEKVGAADPKNYPGQQLPVTENSPVPLPGFAEHVVGLEKNQEKEFTISFPADHGVAELAGKQYHFKVKVSEVKEKHLPEMNDDFAKSAGNNVETVEALRKLVAERLQQASEKRAEAAFQEKVVDAVVGLAKVEFPPIMVEREVDRLLQERDNLLSRQGGLEAYLRTIQKTEKELREEVRPQATTQIARALVLGKLAEDEKIEVGAADIDSEIEEMTKDAANRAGEVRSVFDAPQGRRWISDRLLTQKTVRRLAEIAVGGVQEVVVQQAVNEQVAGSKSNAVADG